MGSTFVSLNKLKSDSKKLFANSRPEAVYLQFVPGQVIDVVTSSTHVMYSDRPRNINSILAKPHYGNKFKRTSTLDEEDRYYPLFRGTVDVPMIGDPVLLCTIGGIQYYMGPINTAGVPGWNPDHLQTPDVQNNFFVNDPDLTSRTENDLIGKSKNWKTSNTVRLEKRRNIELDDPDNERVRISDASGKEIVSDIHGDLIFEGRHGNNIRIGSRNINPYIIISNRNYKNTWLYQLYN